MKTTTSVGLHFKCGCFHSHPWLPKDAEPKCPTHGIKLDTIHPLPADDAKINRLRSEIKQKQRLLVALERSKKK